MQHTTNYNLNQWEAGDRVTREDFNADNAKIDAAIAAKCEVVFGSYRGNGVYPRSIDLGFQPKAVFLAMHDGTTHVSATTFGGTPRAVTRQLRTRSCGWSSLPV